MSSSYHPQTDGQSERTNRTVEEMLRAYVSHYGDDWDQHLVSAEMAINNAVQASTGQCPFYLVYGQRPTYPICLVNNAGSADGTAAVTGGGDDNNNGTTAASHGANNNDDGGSGNPTADQLIEKINDAVKVAKNNLLKAQQRQTQYANQSRRDRMFSVGDRVWLSTANLAAGDRPTKLLPRYLGPYTIKRVINPVAYQLDLPASVRIHNVIHVSRLRAFVDGSDLFPTRDQPVRPAAADVLQDTGEPAWEVQEIINKRVHRIKNKQVTEYLVLWRGYPVSESTWEPAANLREAQWSVQQYENKLSTAPPFPAQPVQRRRTTRIRR
jgi:hypothetical protein